MDFERALAAAIAKELGADYHQDDEGRWYVYRMVYGQWTRYYVVVTGGDFSLTVKHRCKRGQEDRLSFVLGDPGSIPEAAEAIRVWF